jgi:hypothetical protein
MFVVPIRIRESAFTCPYMVTNLDCFSLITCAQPDEYSLSLTVDASHVSNSMIALLKATDK